MNELKPIREEADYEHALRQMKELWGARDGSPEAGRLDILAALAEVLNRKRSLSLEMIRRLHQHLGIPADVLIQPIRSGKAA